MLATIHIVPEKEVVGFRWKSTILKKSQKIIVLAMYITCGLSDQDKTEKKNKITCGCMPHITQTDVMILASINMLLNDDMYEYKDTFI